jgi:hypothetical protein
MARTTLTTRNRMMSRETFAYGFKTRDAAEDALEDALASGDMLPGEQPEISAYSVEGGMAYRITWAH